MNNNEKVPKHCELNATKSSIEETRIITKIKGIINLKVLKNPEVDFLNKVIKSGNKPPIEYLVKLNVPYELRSNLGELYSTNIDEDEIEQSTCILSEEGINIFMKRQITPLIEYLATYEILNFPDKMFFGSINDLNEFNLNNAICSNCGIPYKTTGNKYKRKNIQEYRKDRMEDELPEILESDYFDLSITDCSEKDMTGYIYSFKTDKHFLKIDLCSNECAVESCIKENSVIYYNDFLLKGVLRVLTKDTVSMNTKLKNHYRYRSLNI